WHGGLASYRNSQRDRSSGRFGGEPKPCPASGTLHTPQYEAERGRQQLGGDSSCATSKGQTPVILSRFGPPIDRGGGWLVAEPRHRKKTTQSQSGQYLAFANRNAQESPSESPLTVQLLDGFASQGQKAAWPRRLRVRTARVIARL